MSNPVYLEHIRTRFPSRVRSLVRIAERHGISQSILRRQLAVTSVPCAGRFETEFHMARRIIADLPENVYRGIDSVFFCSANATKPEVAGRIAALKTPDCRIVAQARSGCAGFVESLNLAAKLLGEGFVERSMIVAADRQRFQFKTLESLRFLPFGDGAALAVLCTESTTGGEILPGEVIKVRKPSRGVAEAWENEAPIQYAGMLERMLEKTRLRRGQVDTFALPQMPQRKLERLTKILGIDIQAVPMHFEKYGHVGNVDLPYAVSVLESKKPLSIMLLSGGESAEHFHFSSCMISNYLGSSAAAQSLRNEKPQCQSSQS